MSELEVIYRDYCKFLAEGINERLKNGCVDERQAHNLYFSDEKKLALERALAKTETMKTNVRLFLNTRNCMVNNSSD